jgi:hypothetical protein
MQLKHKGRTILVTLTKPEQAALTKAKDVLAAIAMVPCDQQKGAKAALEALEHVERVGEQPLTKRENTESEEE